MSESKNRILVVSYFFYPENAPRAFRTYELIKEFLKQGYIVDLLLPNKEIYKENTLFLDNLHIKYLGNEQSHRKNPLSTTFKKESLFRNILRFLYRFFNPFTQTLSYIKLVNKELKKNKSSYQLLISIAYPVACHFGTALALKSNKSLRKIPVKVAEYSDPFYSDNGPKIFFIYKYLDRIVSGMFDYITIPTEKAISAYTKHKKIDEIKVIPQGFNFDDISIDKYKVNSIPTFAYAGVFYHKIRNPKKLFEYLESLEIDYKFYLFTSKNNTDSIDFVKMFQSRLGDKLVVEYNVERLILIKRLSLMDFLININNISQHQSPSKLIDYTLTKRPVFSFDQTNFSESKFHHFMNGNFDYKPFNLEPYEIKNVAKKFLDLN